MAIVPIMTKKWGEKKVFIGMALYGFVVTFAAFFLYFAGVRSLVSVLIMLFFVGLMWGYHQFLPMVMVADCVDYYEHKTGKRTEGVHYAVLSFSIKLSAAIGIGMGLVMVGLSGYSATSVSFSKQTQDIIYAAYLLLPGLSSLLCALPILKYTLVGKEKQRITEELAERRAQLALEQSGAEAGVNADANGEVSEKNEKSEE
jgi:GPH family glycoside/pentoside/hexuronide:cation symporter